MAKQLNYTEAAQELDAVLKNDFQIDLLPDVLEHMAILTDQAIGKGFEGKVLLWSDAEAAYAQITDSNVKDDNVYTTICDLHLALERQLDKPRGRSLNLRLRYP